MSYETINVEMFATEPYQLSDFTQKQESYAAMDDQVIFLQTPSTVGIMSNEELTNWILQEVRKLGFVSPTLILQNPGWCFMSIEFSPYADEHPVDNFDSGHRPPDTARRKTKP